MTVSGTVRDNASPGTVIGTEDEVSASEVELAVGAIRSKEVYAVNGDASYDPDLPIAAGDM